MPSCMLCIYMPRPPSLPPTLIIVISQDRPLVDDVKVTLDYDMEASLAAPRWLDGYQQFVDVPYSPGLVVIVDVRCVVPGSGSSAPAGWACLPVFERAGRFVASDTYQLPLFQVRLIIMGAVRALAGGRVLTTLRLHSRVSGLGFRAGHASLQQGMHALFEVVVVPTAFVYKAVLACLE